jgi:Flp pilus assembly protein TadG
MRLRLILLFGKRNHHQAAQGIVEFALILPILLLVVYGLLETGRVIVTYNSVVTAARQAARYGSASGLVDTNEDDMPDSPRYQYCKGMRESAQGVAFIGLINRVALINLINNEDITLYYDSGPGTTQTAYCSAGTTKDASVTLNTGERIMAEVSADYTPILPLVPFGTIPISASSARTILGSITLSEGTPQATATATSPPPTATNTSPPPTATATTPPQYCRVTYTTYPSYYGNFSAHVVIYNTGSSNIYGWTLTWTFPGSQRITSMSGASYTQYGQNVSVSNLWSNRTIYTGSSVNFDFYAYYNWWEGNDPPDSFSLNGVTCTQ